MVKFSNTKILNKVKWVAEHAFLTFLFLFFVSLLLGAIMFYVYNTLAQQTEPQLEVVSPEFKEKLYQDILKEWQLREEKFESAASKQEYPKLFWID